MGKIPYPQHKYDPYSNTYNPGWRDHPNLRYRNQEGDFASQNQDVNQG
jgi:hypothetical protein